MNHVFEELCYYAAAWEKIAPRSRVSTLVKLKCMKSGGRIANLDSFEIQLRTTADRPGLEPGWLIEL